MSTKTHNNEEVFEEFLHMCPYVTDVADEIVDWWDGQDAFEIIAIKRDGSAYLYDAIDKGFKQASSVEDLKEHPTNEEEWRNAFARRLYRMICLRGLSQDDLAYETGISTGAMSRYVNGYSTPSVYKLISIADVLGCTLDELARF